MNAKLVIAIVVCALIGLAASEETNGKPSEMEGSSVEELATRLLQATDPGRTELNEVQLLAGKLPDDMPVDLPIPDGAGIVGARSRETWESTWFWMSP